MATYDYARLLDETADRSPDRVALLAGERRITYAEVQSQSRRLATALQARSLGPEDRVAVCLGNDPEWVFLFFALCRLRACAVPLPSAWRFQEIRHAMALTRPQALVATRGSLELFEGVDLPDLRVTSGPGEPVDGWAELRELLEVTAEPLPEAVSSLDPSDLELALPFSSGTTGLPKAVRHTHRSLVVATTQWRECLDIGPDDRLQALTPLAHILGIVNIGATFLGEGTIRLFPKFTPRSMVESFQADRITIGMTVAPIAAALAAMPDLEEFDLSSLRYLNWSATPVNRDIAEEVTRRTGIAWLPAYGTTEVPIIAVNPVTLLPHGRLDSVGLTVPGVEVEAVDLVSQEFLPRGEPGEIVVRSPARMQGYLDEPGSPFLDGGWYRTGDIGQVDPDGYVMLTDRLKDIIKVSGNQVSPVEIERVLLTSPLVQDCAVFGVADDRRGEVPCAVVVPTEGTRPEAEELIEWMASQLAPYKQLREIVFVGEIPRTPSGKILRRQLSSSV